MGKKTFIHKDLPATGNSVNCTFIRMVDEKMVNKAFIHTGFPAIRNGVKCIKNCVKMVNCQREKGEKDYINMDFDAIRNVLPSVRNGVNQNNIYHQNS